MKKVLIVDRDASAVSMLSDELRTYHVIELTIADNVDAAIRHLGEGHFDLMVCELNMPEFGGFSLLAHAHRNHSGMPIIVMTGSDSIHMKAKVSVFGISHFFEKPLDLEMITQKIIHMLDIGDKGLIGGISLPAFLQMVELEGKTCTLTVQSEEKTGYIHCMNGELIAANVSHFKGADALYRILAFESPRIRVDEVCRKKYREIEMPLMHLLMEGHRKQDDDELKEPEIEIADASEIEELDIFEISDTSGNSEAYDTQELFSDDMVNVPDTGTGIRGILENAHGVYEYKIFDKDGGLLEESLTEDSQLKAAPSRFTVIGDRLTNYFNCGPLRYIVISSGSGTRYSILRHEDKLIAALLGAGVRTENLITELGELSRDK